MLVKEIMTKDVASLNVDDTVERAAQIMKEHDIGSVPVCNGEKVVGMITDRDITIRTVAMGENPKILPVRKIMSSNPVMGNVEMDISDAARIMSERQVRRLPVVDQGNLVGVISLGDIATNPYLKTDAENALSSISETYTFNN